MAGVDIPSPEAGQPPEQGGADAARSPLPGWRQLWQVPALVFAGAALVGTLALAVSRKPEPPVDAMLGHAAQLVHDHEYEGAIDYINEKLLPFEAAGKLDEHQSGSYHLTLARAMFSAQRMLKIDHEANHRRILDEFAQARQRGAEVAPVDEFAIAATTLALGDSRKAVELARSLPADFREQAQEILREAVELELSTRAGDRSEALRLISEFLAGGDISAEDRAWAAEHQGRALIDQGYADEAIAKLLREMQRFDELGAERLAPLHALLGEAYLETGAIDSAARQIERAQEAIDETDPLGPRLMLLRAWVDQAQGDAESARERFAAITEESGLSDEVLPALLGLGECESVLGQTAASLEAYRALAEALRAGRTHPAVDRTLVEMDLLRRSEERSQSGELQQALEFAVLAKSLFPAEDLPAEVLLRLTRCHRALADELLLAGRKDPSRPIGLEDLDPASREEARQHLIAAGECARRHAGAVSVSDNAAYGESIWLAADSFDLAGDAEEAIANFQEFVSAFPEDVRRFEARYRLGQAFQARGEYAVAADFYKALIDERNSRASAGAGPYGDRSFVPLAQTYLLDTDAGNDAEAERLLVAVVSGEVIVDPSAPAFRDGLVELGKHYYTKGDYARAIERLREALERFPGDPDESLLRFRLGDSMRRSAGAIAGQLSGSLPEMQRLELEQQRAARLSEGLELFAQAIELLEVKDQRRRTRLEEQCLRNAYFFRAACAFDLGDYASAIRAYDAAYDRYPADPASLVALVQIVNSYVELGDLERAHASNERARRFFRSLPDEAWNDPYLPMSRADWERWLDSTSRLYGMGEER